MADEDGLSSLTMRRLAHELGVEAMSLYNHVANKVDLLDGIVDLAVEEIELPDRNGSFDEQLRRCAISAHETYLRHTWACPLVMAPSSSGAINAPRLRYMEAVLGCLADAGCTPGLVYRGYHAIDSHVLGFTMWELGHGVGGDVDLADLAAAFIREWGDDYPHLVEHARQHFSTPLEGSVSEFEFGLDLILEGLRRARESSPRATPSSSS